MRPQNQDQTMQYYRAQTAGGQEFYRASRYDSMSCAVVIYPLEDGGGLFPTTTVDWYSDRPQAERHAADWRRFGHHVEVVCCDKLDEAQYRLLTGSQQQG